MNIIFLCKRHYMQNDVIADRYARLYELPNQLALQGHNIRGLCLSYHPSQSGFFKHYQSSHGLLEWYSFNVGSLIIPGFIHYLSNTLKLVKVFKPDILLGSSDCLHAALTALFSKLLNIPYYLDLYDNYESFGMAKIPGLLALYRRAIKNAAGICCVSEPLADYIRQTYGHRNVITLESTINSGEFFPQDKVLCRQQLNLPADAKLIGLAGSLDKNRGIDLLYASFLQLADIDASLHLALAGATDAACPIPDHPRIHYLGLLPHRQINVFYNALDLAMICLLDGDFGRYAFPQKTYEILACNIPVLAPRLGALAQTLKDYTQCLYQPGYADDMRDNIAALLNQPCEVNIPIPTWAEQAARLAAWMQS